MDPIDFQCMDKYICVLCSTEKKKIIVSCNALTVTLHFCLSTVNFDHFQILRAIGKGSFGKVSFAEYLLENKPIIKTNEAHGTEAKVNCQ